MSLALTVGMACAAFGQMPGYGRSPIERDIIDPFSLPAKTVYAKDHIVVDYFDNASETAQSFLENRLGLIKMPSPHNQHFQILQISKQAQAVGMTVEKAVTEMMRYSMVRYAEFDPLLVPDFFPNDTNFGQMWGLHNTGQTGGVNDADIDMPEAWDSLAGAGEAVVAVCDDGFDFSHPDLNSAYKVNDDPANGVDDDGNGYVDDFRGWDFSDGDNYPQPAGGDSHGTHTSGTVGAEHNNGLGVTGFGNNIKVMPMRIYGGSNPWMTALANAVIYASDNGATAISVSYNIDGFTNALNDAIGYADDNDVVYVNSAGNNNQLNSPRSQLRDMHNNVIFAAASTDADTKASFSNYGENVDIFAPGQDVLSTVPGGGYSEFSGTSMACPHVAGAVGALRSKFPALSDRQALDLLIAAADQIPGLASYVPNGARLNLNNALESDSTPPAPVGNLEISRRAYTAGEFTMIATGDDGNSGAASSYEVRMSDSPINNGNFGSATLLETNIPTPAAGTPITFQAMGFVPGKPVYVAVRAFDNFANASDVVSFGPFQTRTALWMDDVEGSSQWTGTGTWGTTTSQSSSPTHSWADSPSGNYGNNVNSTLTMNSSFGANGHVALKFKAMTALAASDILYVELSRNGGAFQTIGQITGSTAWKTFGYTVDAGAGTNLLFRLRMFSNGSTTSDGVYVDDIAIVPLVTAFADDVEGSSHFNATGSWGMTTSQSNSPTHSWTDSPSGNYTNNVNSNITSNVDVDVRGVAAPLLTFFTRYDLESNYDYLYVEVSGDSGANYETLTALNGTNTTWHSRGFILPPAEFIRLRLRLDTDGSVIRDGAYFDDFLIVGEPWEDVEVVTGTIDLQFWEGSIGSRQLQVEVRNPNSATALETLSLTMNPGSGSTQGTYQFITGVGTRDIAFKVDGYLRRVVQDVNITNGMGAVDAMLLIGDIDNNNAVDETDDIIMKQTLNSAPGSPNYDPRCDLDGNGVIDEFDQKKMYQNLPANGDN